MRCNILYRCKQRRITHATQGQLSKLRLQKHIQQASLFESFKAAPVRAAVSMLPLLLLKTAQGHPVLVELKSGETYNGHMVQCDSWMNVHLREVICTSKDGDRFWRMPEAYIRGNTIKYLRVPDEVIDKVREDSHNRAEKRPMAGARGRGRGRAGPGRGDGPGGRGGARGPAHAPVGRGEGAFGGRGRG